MIEFMFVLLGAPAVAFLLGWTQALERELVWKLIAIAIILPWLALLLMNALPGASAKLRHRIAVVTSVFLLALPILSVFVPPWTLAVLPTSFSDVNQPQLLQMTENFVGGSNLGVENSSDSRDLDHISLADNNPVRPLDFANDSIEQHEHESERSARTGLGKLDGDSTDASTYGVERFDDTPNSDSSTLRRAEFFSRWTMSWWLIAIWSAGVVVGLLWWTCAWIATSTQVNRLPNCNREFLAKQWTGDIVGQPLLALVEKVKLRISLPDSMPYLFGIKSPTIVLPENWQGWSSDRLQAVVLHELAHVARRDLLTDAIARAANILWWWSPGAVSYTHLTLPTKA
jgi:hypothetical protein